eukprot:m51a1_g9235 hypothetical protein (610) ;mRNA; f:89399-92014
MEAEQEDDMPTAGADVDDDDDGADSDAEVPCEPDAEPPPNVVLTEDMIKEQAMVADVGEVETLEITFSRVQSLGQAFQGCSKLRELTLIKTHLADASGLASLANTLTSLCLSEQGLEALPPAIGSLRSLRELFLQCNAIGDGAALAGLSSLQRLWLYSNRLERVDWVAPLCSLRELWLQDNSGLVGLTGLYSLSFEDSYFAPCPIVALPAYRASVAHHMRHVSLIDGAGVTERERSQAQDSHVVRAREFQEKMSEAGAEHEAALREVRRRRSDLAARERALRERIASSVASLERTVDDSQARVRNELRRALAAYDERRRAFDKSLQGHVRQFAAEVERVRQAQRQRYDAEQRVFEAERARVRCEEEWDAFLAAERPVTVRCLDPLASEFSAAAGLLGSERVSKVFRVFSSAAEDRVNEATTTAHKTFVVMSAQDFHQLVDSNLDFTQATDARGFAQRNIKSREWPSFVFIVCKACFSKTTRWSPKTAVGSLTAKDLCDAPAGNSGVAANEGGSLHVVVSKPTDERPWAVSPEYAVFAGDTSTPEESFARTEEVLRALGKAGSAIPNAHALREIERAVEEEFAAFRRDACSVLAGLKAQLAERQKEHPRK